MSEVPADTLPVAAEDDARITRARAGDPAAFEALVRGHHPWLYRLAVRALGDPAEAEDLVQAVFLTLFEALPRFEARGALGGWLKTTLVRRARDWRARGRPEPRAELPPSAAPEGEEPDAVAGRRDRDRELARAMATLPADQRLALVLRYHEGAGYAEIGELLEVSPKAAEGLLRRGRRALREKLEESSRVSGG